MPGAALPMIAILPMRSQCVARAAVLALAGALAMFAAERAGAASSLAPLSVTEVQPGVFVHNGVLEDWGPANGGDVANLGFVVGSRCVAVIDTGGTPEVGRALHAAIERVTPLPVCYVIDTHAHPDHMLGNIAFVAPNGSEGPKFVASASFARTLAAREPYYLNALQRDFGITLSHQQIVYPTLGVEKTLDLDLGDRVLTLQAWPTAHTDNDLTVFDRRTRMLFAGDLLFISHLPALDGSLRGWIEVMAELRKIDAATVVPGHGAVSHDWPQAMKPQADYLNGLLRDVRAAIANGWTISEATERIGVPSGTNWLLTDRFHRRNVTAAYAELEWEDDPAKLPTPPSSAAKSVSDTRSGQR